MTNEEIKIRRRAIEVSNKIVEECSIPCIECAYGELLKDGRVPCIAAKGYERGFADGVEEGKRLAIKHAHWTPTEYDGYADGNPVWDVYTCSACGDEHYGDSDTLTDFCPCCGARMDEEGEKHDNT